MDKTNQDGCAGCGGILFAFALFIVMLAVAFKAMAWLGGVMPGYLVLILCLGLAAVAYGIHVRRMEGFVGAGHAQQKWKRAFDGVVAVAVLLPACMWVSHCEAQRQPTGEDLIYQQLSDALDVPADDIRDAVERDRRLRGFRR
jgi:hypothetical protein